MEAMTRARRRPLVSRGPLYLFAAPAVAIYGLFFVWPTLQALYYSLFNWEGPGTSPAYVGLENFKTKFSDDKAKQEAKELIDAVKPPVDQKPGEPKK